MTSFEVEKALFIKAIKEALSNKFERFVSAFTDEAEMCEENNIPDKSNGKHKA